MWVRVVTELEVGGLFVILYIILLHAVRRAIAVASLRQRGGFHRYLRDTLPS